MRRVVGWVVTIALVGVPAIGSPSPGVPPRDAAHCPDEHPVKGHATRQGAMVFYPPGSPQYDRAAPERCYASETEAREAGYRAGREERRPVRDRR